MKKFKPDGTSTIYIGGLYEVDLNSGGTATKKTSYYPAGGAMRVEIVGTSNTLYFMLRDHLGSASVTLDASGNTVAEMRYYPFGETRASSGAMPTDRLYTGQRDVGLGGLYHYNARFYLPKLGRFVSADSIVPNWANPQSLNRYGYVLGNPLNYVDPTGHEACYGTKLEIGSDISQADCWAYGLDRFMLDLPVSPPKPGEGYSSNKAGVLHMPDGSLYWIGNFSLDELSDISARLRTVAGANKPIADGYAKFAEGAMTMVGAGVGGYVGGLVGTSVCAVDDITIVGIANDPICAVVGMGGGAAAGGGIAWVATNWVVDTINQSYTTYADLADYIDLAIANRRAEEREKLKSQGLSTATISNDSSLFVTVTISYNNGDPSPATFFVASMPYVHTMDKGTTFLDIMAVLTESKP